jgi:toxin ParE1/3/4
MRRFEVRPDVPLDIEEAADWYDAQRPGLGAAFIVEAGRVLREISIHGDYVTVPYERLGHVAVRRVFLDRFPYRVFFVESAEARIVLRVLHNHRSDTHWRSSL